MSNRVLKLLRSLIFIVGFGVVALSAVGDINWFYRYFGPLDLMLITNGLGLMFGAVVMRPKGLIVRLVSWLGVKINTQRAILRVLLLSILSSTLLAAWIVAMEGILTLGMDRNQDMYYATLAERNLPCLGAPLRLGTVTIAVFGESSAQGWGTNASFGQIMEREIPLRYPGHEVCVTNFAEPGSWFHGRQAELAKVFVKDYDISIIFTGHNEFAQYYKSVTFLKPEFRGLPIPVSQSLRMPRWSNPAIRQIELKSRVFAVLKRGLEPYLEPIFTTARTRAIQPSEFEFSLAIPVESKEKILDNWQQDMIDIAEISQENHKLLLLSSLPGNESYKPFYSVYKPGISAIELDKFQASYKCGVEESQKQQFSAAMECYKRALAIDDQVAILNWRIGTTEFLLGNRDRAREYLRRSIDQDGFFIRSISSLHQISKSVAEAYDNVIFVDPIVGFHYVEDLGVNANDNFFLDMHHPSSLGNKILAEVFMCELALRKPFLDFEARNPCIPFTEWNWDDEILANRLAGWDIRAAFWNVFQTSNLSAYPEDFYSDSDKRLARFDQTDFFVFARALLKAGSSKDKSGSVKLLNETVAKMPQVAIDQITSVPMPNHQTLIAAAREIGFNYDTAANQFEYHSPEN